MRSAKIITALLLLLCALLFSACGKTSEAPSPAPAEPEPYINVSLSDGRSFSLYEGENEYTVPLPDGHPAVPEVSASFASEKENADDGKDTEQNGISVVQALLPLNSRSSFALINAGDENIKITFKKDRSLGFVLQYDDSYYFMPDYPLDEGQSFTFEFEGEPDNLKLDAATGEIVVTGVSGRPATVHAYLDGGVVDSLVIDRTVKAPLDLFLLAGQGNAAGIGGSQKDAPVIARGRAYFSEVDNTAILDLSDGREGMMSSFAYNWYDRTGRKLFVLYAGFPRTSVTEWRRKSRIYKTVGDSLTYFENHFGSPNSGYEIKNRVLLWMQGEIDVSSDMEADMYYKNFESMFDGLKEEHSFALCGIVPVRSAGSGGISGVEAAQYALHGKRNDVYVLTRLPGKATVENGFVNQDGIYYTQYGYNELGSEASETLYCVFSPEVGKEVAEVNMFDSPSGENVDGRVIISSGDTLRTLIIAEPLYARDKTVSYSSEGRARLTEYFEIKADTDLGDGETAVLTFGAGGKTSEIKVIGINEKMNEGLSEFFDWTFAEKLEEVCADNPLSVSPSSTRGYLFSGGYCVLDGRTDLLLKYSFTVNSERGWYVEWSGTVSDNGILAGGNGRNTGYILLAPYSERFGNSVRIVADSGEAIYLPYGEYADSNKTDGVWRIEYSSEESELRLLFNGETVSQTSVSGFRITLSNLFGRYGGGNSPYCLSGKMIYVRMNVD